MAETTSPSHNSLQSPNSIDSIPQTLHDNSIASPASKVSSPAPIDVSHNSSPSLPSLSQVDGLASVQHQQISPSLGSDYPSPAHQKMNQQQPAPPQFNLAQHQQPNLLGASAYQLQQTVQRSSSAARLNQIQQQQQLGIAISGGLRQHYGQMNFTGSALQQPQNQQQNPGAGNLPRSALIGQGIHVPILSGQTTASGQYNMQSQMLPSPKQKPGLVQGMQFQKGNSSGQPLLGGLQAMGAMGPLCLSPQIRVGGSLNYAQRMAQAQIRQQLSAEASLASSQQARTPSLAFMNAQLTGAAGQSPQTAMFQNALSQQQCQQLLKQMPSPTSPSQRWQQQQRQQQILLQQQQQHMASSLSPQQLSKLVQHQQQQQHQHQQQQQTVIGNPQLQQKSQQMQQTEQQQQFIHEQQLHQQLQKQHFQRQMLLQQQQRQQQQHEQVLHHGRQDQALVQQQPPPLMMVPGGYGGGHKSSGFNGSHPDVSPSAATTPGGSSSQITEATNQLLGKRTIQDLVSQVDSHGKIDPEVEDLLLEIADDFIDSVTTFACKLAKHRKSSTLESKDLLLHLEKHWQLKIPGFSGEDQKHEKRVNDPQ